MIVQGNMFNSTAECIVNPTNSVGVMGAGLAKQFAAKYPNVCADFNDHSKSSQIDSKQYILIDPVLYIKEVWHTDKSILMFPTKIHWKNPSTLPYIEGGLEESIQLIKEHHIVSIAFPALGCGLGGLPKAMVIDIMSFYLDKIPKLDYEIYV